MANESIEREEVWMLAEHNARHASRAQIANARNRRWRSEPPAAKMTSAHTPQKVASA